MKDNSREPPSLNKREEEIKWTAASSQRSLREKPSKSNQMLAPILAAFDGIAVWFPLACRAVADGLVRRCVHQFHWRKSFTQSINWFHSTLSFHSIDFIHSLFNPLIPLPFFLPPSSLSRGALRLQPPLTHSKEKAGRKATPSKLFRSAQPSIKPNQLPNQFH